MSGEDSRMEASNDGSAMVPPDAESSADEGPGGTDRAGLTEDALHIQAAAVAAQQGTLTQHEMRLQRRRTELEQHEQQLADHLEKKLQRLESLRDDARQAHATLQRDRAAYEKRVADVLGGLATDRRGLANQEREVQQRRDRLLQLQRRLRRRWHRRRK